MDSRLLHQGLHQGGETTSLHLEGSIRPEGRLAVGFGDSFGNPENPAPEFVVKTVLEVAGPTSEGELVRAVAVPWFMFLEMIQRDPESIYQIDARVWEELIAGAYSRAGFTDVILTPRSGDYGRDVVATKRGVGTIRIFDQVKAYHPGNVVTAEEVRAMLGVITGAQNVSKGVITTTSSFAPRIPDNPYIAPYLPYRLELKPRDVLLPWLDQLAGGQGTGSD
jgi:restriction system protein